MTVSTSADFFLTIESSSFAEIRERGSRFLAYAFPVEQEEQFKVRLQELRKEHHQAVHHCSAFILGKEGSFQKFSDDREPSNSAGRPILRAILSLGLTNTAVIVVRYFGGKLLGVPGLIQAYQGAAELALKEAKIIQVRIGAFFTLETPIHHENDLFRFIRQVNGEIKEHIYTEGVQIRFEVDQSRSNLVKDKLVEFPFFKLLHTT